VIDRLCTRTGRTRAGEHLVRDHHRKSRVEQPLERRQRRVQPGRHGGGVVVGPLELVGGVDLDRERDGLVRRPIGALRLAAPATGLRRARA
jgi:hypothetical protein